MSLKIEKIYLSRELRIERNLEVEDDNTDVIVKTKNGEIYIAPFFSYQSIPKIFRKHKISGDFLNGQYFWMANMILIQECSLEKIELVINDLLVEGDLDLFLNAYSANV